MTVHNPARGIVSAREQFNTAHISSSARKNPAPRITLRLTEDELLRLKQAAAGISLSVYVRKKLFGENVSFRKTRSRAPVKDSQALAQILGKLGQSHMANNLNQIAYQANAGSLLMDEQTEQEINIACAQIAWMRVKLIEALGLKTDAQK
jgi:hypothetical protein